MLVALVLVAALSDVVTQDGRGQEDCVPPDESTGEHIAVRSADRSLLGHIADGRRRSRTFASLATTIAEHGVLVYVEWRPTIKTGLTGALLHEVFRGANGTKYLRVFVLHGRSRRAVIATIAHELQHVIELLEHGTDDFASAHSSERSHGRAPRTDLQIYETKAAERVGAAVAREIAGCRRY